MGGDWEGREEGKEGEGSEERHKEQQNESPKEERTNEKKWYIITSNFEEQMRIIKEIFRSVGIV